MMTIEEYIKQVKKKEKIDEFDFKSHSENMTTILQCVMEYFNSYLDPVTFDFEKNKVDQAIAKFKPELVQSYPESAEFIIEIFRKTKYRLDKLLTNAIEDSKDSELIYSDDDYSSLLAQFRNAQNWLDSSTETESLIINLLKEIKRKVTNAPTLADLKHLDNNIVDWVKDTYIKYGVNLYEFASHISNEYSEQYIELIYDRPSETFYYVNSYDYRYQDNAFGINGIYERNIHRPFIVDHKGELEMLIMQDWLFEEVKDTDYWPEYVNLCISRGRVKLARHINVLVPVLVNGIAYPLEMTSDVQYFETNDGLIAQTPSAPYILRISHKTKQKTIWDDEHFMSFVVSNLHMTFKEKGVPEVLEILSPHRSSQYTEVQFFEAYTPFEKSMQRYKSMKLALVNGLPQNRNLPEYLVTTINEIEKVRAICKEMKYRLKLAIDFSESSRRSALREDIDKTFASLSSMRNDVVCVHLSSTDSSGYIKRFYESEDKNSRSVYVNRHEYNQLSNFLEGLSMFLRDSKPRYLIPDKVKSESHLEDIVDMLLRSGFFFKTMGASND